MAKREYVYNFPPNSRAGDYQEQLKHAAGEIVEAAMERDGSERIMELLDAIECLEQALRKVGTHAEICSVNADHFLKNFKRGDYPKEELYGL